MSLNCIRRTPAREEGSAIDDKIRALIAAHFEVDVSRVTDEAHFIEDLGADWLDRLELMILIEDQFAGVEIEDDDLNQIEVVGDLIHYIEARIVRRDGQQASGSPKILLGYDARSRGRANMP